MIAKVNYLWYVKKIEGYQFISTFDLFLINYIQAKL